MTVAWPEAQLSEIARPVVRPIAVLPGTQFRTIGVKWWGEGAYERQTIDGSQTAAKILSVVRAGDLIINKIWVRHGSTAIASQSVDGCAASGEFPTFELDSKLVLPQWIHWHTKTRGFWAACDALSRGSSGKNRIKPDLFLTIRVPLPSIDEQRRIVERIEAIAGKVAEARRLRGEAEEEADALVNAILRRTAVRLGEEYRPVPLGQLITSASYGTSEKCSSERRVNQVPVLRIPNVASEQLCLDDLKYAALTDHELAKTSLESGDILIVRTNGSLGLVGRSAVVADLSEQTSFASYLIRLRFDSTQLRPEFAQRMLRYLRIDNQLVDLARTTAGQYNVSLGRLKGAAVPVPPLAIQDQVLAELDRCQSSVYSALSDQRGTNQSIEYLMPAVLDTAFRGEM